MNIKTVNPSRFNQDVTLKNVFIMVMNKVIIKLH